MKLYASTLLALMMCADLANVFAQSRRERPAGSDRPSSSPSRPSSPSPSSPSRDVMREQARDRAQQNRPSAPPSSPTREPRTEPRQERPQQQRPPQERPRQEVPQERPQQQRPPQERPRQEVPQERPQQQRPPQERPEVRRPQPDVVQRTPRMRPGQVIAREPSRRIEEAPVRRAEASTIRRRINPYNPPAPRVNPIRYTRVGVVRGLPGHLRPYYGTYRFFHPYCYTYRPYFSYYHSPWTRVYRHSVFYNPFSYYDHLRVRYAQSIYFHWILWNTAYANGYYDIDNYPYYVYNGYRHRYSNVDRCNYQLIDKYTQRVVTNYWEMQCNFGYDQCSNERDDRNYREGEFRFFCAETYRPRDYQYFNSFNENDYQVGGYNTNTAEETYYNDEHDQYYDYQYDYDAFNYEAEDSQPDYGPYTPSNPNGGRPNNGGYYEEEIYKKI